MILLSKVSYELENHFVSSPGTVSIICYLTKYTSVSQKWSLNNHNRHLPRCSDFDWCLVINFTPARWTTGRNVRKLSKRKWLVWFLCHSTHVSQRFPSQKHCVVRRKRREEDQTCRCLPVKLFQKFKENEVKLETLFGTTLISFRIFDSL